MPPNNFQKNDDFSNENSSFFKCYIIAYSLLVILLVKVVEERILAKLRYIICEIL